jgi:uncharacterized protein YuzE
MRITFDEMADAMYIYLNEGQVTKTEEKGEYLVDYDAAGVPVGIEVLSVSEKSDFFKIAKVAAGW